MIPLPKGCKVGYEIRFMVKELTNDMGEWFLLQDGRCWAEEYYDNKGRRQMKKFVQYGTAKPSYAFQDGTCATLVRFSGTDASLASLFLMKYFDEIETHNMQEAFDRYEQEN